MQQLKILKRKEVKELIAKFNKQWGYTGKLDYTFLQSSKDKIYIVNNDISRIDISRLRIDKLGLYFCTIVNNNEIRLSIDGAQLIGAECNKNIVELNEAEMKEWLQGLDLEKEAAVKGFALIKHNSDYLGTGKVHQRKILNYIPKARRIKTSI
ncbi:hypothetical protein HYV81_05770 [Candidatus Woesearchaeota archaeon]|nr:hypothetical protein [Candidatus Woesearchaeota archaeon]